MVHPRFARQCSLLLPLFAVLVLTGKVRAQAPDLAGEFQKLVEQAEAGRTEAQYYLGLRHLHGVGMPKDEAAALRWFERAAAGGDAGAAFNLARMLKEGRVVTADPRRAIQLFREAIREGVQGARLELGEMLLTAPAGQRDFIEAAALFREAAVAGNATAAFNLGVMHARGWGVAKDPAEAMRWYERAAEGGEPNAQFNVAAALLDRNMGVDNAGRIVNLLTQSAAQGVSAAMFTLGRIHEEGVLVSESFRTAVRWYRAAVAEGHEGAMSNLARLLIQKQLGAESDAEAVKLLETAAAQLDPSALFNLGALQERGIIVKRDRTAAAESYRLAAELGFGPAQLALALLLASSSERDDQVRGVAWGVVAREQGIKLPGDEKLEQLPDAVLTEGRFNAESLRAEIARTRALREDGADVATVMLRRVRPAKASVNGFIVSPDGVIVSPYSPIASASEIKVRHDGELTQATIIGVDEARDVAVLSISRKVGRWLPLSRRESPDSSPLRGVWFHRPWEVTLEAPLARVMRPVVAATPFGADREWLAVDSVWDTAAHGGAVLDETGVVAMLGGKRAVGGTALRAAQESASEYGVVLRASFVERVVALAGAQWPVAGSDPIRPEDVTSALVVVLGF